MKKLDKAERDVIKEMTSERAQVDALFARLKAAKEGTEEYNAAKSAIMNKYGEYLKGLGDEKTALNDVALAYKTITEKATEAAKARAYDKYTTEAADDYGESMAKIREKVKKELDKKYKGQTDEDGVSLAETYYWKIVPILEGLIKRKKLEMEQLAKLSISIQISYGILSLMQITQGKHSIHQLSRQL